MAKIRKDPKSGVLVFHHTPSELEKIRKRKQLINDMGAIHSLRIEMEKQLDELKAQKK